MDKHTNLIHVRLVKYFSGYCKHDYFECCSKSLDKSCSLTLLAFLESFLRMAEHSKPVTKTTK